MSGQVICSNCGEYNQEQETINNNVINEQINNNIYENRNIESNIYKEENVHKKAKCMVKNFIYSGTFLAVLVY